ncbi:hypothetical protein [Stenotrophomonas sp.]|uniref:hypothetical protein n=1 Tax=Stenotrophomonas sp. TaxID=69392 RepID=UPI0028A5927A|nr:hypothetical protein [Stenotrophomonas sp.]
MSEIILFHQRMHFTALRQYSASAGLGGVVAVFFAPMDPGVSHDWAPPTNGAVAMRLVADGTVPTTDPAKEPGRLDGRHL